MITTLTRYFMVVIGLILITGAFTVDGLRAAFSSGPLLPISKTGRVILFFGGILVIMVSVRDILQSR